jgi:serine/threonine protein kinase
MKTDPKTISPGLQIGEYIIEKKLGEGGMGEVWSGKHPQIGKQVAIKILGSSLQANSQNVARFVQEARAVNEIQHRNIVDIFSFGELPDGRPYFVMEYLRGKSLSEYLIERGPLPFSELLMIMEQVCSALAACHSQSIIHRDLKPENIFLVFEGTGRNGPSIFVKLLDFGIAKIDSSGKESLTGSGIMMGTPAYMSPEQCEGAKHVDHRSDIYSLGIILCELLTGRTPFREGDDGIGVIISKHMFMAPPPPSSMVSGRKLPFALDLLVLRALAKKPEERPVSCMELYEDLARTIGEDRNETSESLQGAKPIYPQGAAGVSDPLKKAATAELAKRNTPQPDALGSAVTKMASTTSPPTTKRTWAFGAVSIAVLLAAGAIYFVSTPASSEDLATKVNPRMEILEEPVQDSSLQVPLPLNKIKTTTSQPTEETPETKEEPATTTPKKTTNKKKTTKTTKNKDSLLLKDDD